MTYVLGCVGVCSWESKPVSDNMLEAIRLAIEARDGPALKPAFTAAGALMRIDDSMRDKRVEEVLGTLLMTMLVQQQVSQWL